MRKFRFILPLTTLLLLSSCAELMYISVEQMLPPEIMPEPAVCSIGVVSNFSQNNVVIVNDNAIILPCDADSVKEQVAQAFANSGIMERVVVLDSLLYHPDSTTTHILTQSEVNDLCYELNVEMLYSIDYACLTFNPKERFIAFPLNAYLCSRIYIPDRDSIQGTNILDKETLDYWVNDTKEISFLLPQIPSLLAHSAIAPYLPSWKERERVFYHDRLCYELREAKVFVYEGNWEAAVCEWRKLLNKSKISHYRFMAAYNIALYHEMTDDIEQALISLDRALQLAYLGSDKDIALIEQYREVLQNRKIELELLKSAQK